jgi:gamma-aminobutyric acid receptor subunit beta
MSDRNRFLAAAVIFVALLLTAGTAPAENQAGTRPNLGGAPDEVTVGIGLLDVVDIDNRQQVFTVDIFVQIQWRDPRLAIEGDVTDDYRTFAVSDIWTPRLTVVNSRGLDVLLPEVVTVDRQGNVELRQRLAGPLAVELDLRDFPFDTQLLPIEIVSYQYSPDELVFSPASKLVARLDDLSGNGWAFALVEPEISVYRLSDNGPGSSLLTFAVLAKRDAGYYTLTLALPMTLILFLAWMAHWLPPDLVPARMGIASATVFSLIAFGVSFRLTLPPIAYLTIADRFVVYANVLVLLSLIVTVVSTRWITSEREAASIRLCRYSRLAFPWLYVLVTLLAFTT